MIKWSFHVVLATRAMCLYFMVSALAGEAVAALESRLKDRTRMEAGSCGGRDAVAPLGP